LHDLLLNLTIPCLWEFLPLYLARYQRPGGRSGYFRGVTEPGLELGILCAQPLALGYRLFQLGFEDVIALHAATPECGDHQQIKMTV
jgi:hypothetical protein